MNKSLELSARKRFFTLSYAVLLMALLVAPGASARQPASESKPWQFGISIYGWFPDIAGETAFTQPGGSNDFTIDIDDILDNLEFTLMGSFDVRKGRWGFLTDAIYMDVGNSKTGTRNATIGGTPIPVDATADVDFDMESRIWTLTGYYRTLENAGASLDVVFGARYLDVEQKVNWDINFSGPAIGVTFRW
jgi:hypothetical protein